MDAYAACAATVRGRDRDRYLSDLFAPEATRRHLFALHAFNAEVSRVRDAVSQPLTGEMRLQWWRDAILNRDGGGNPLATALIETIDRFALPLTAFDNLLAARVFDLYDDEMPTLNDLEGYLGETVSAVFQLGAMICAGETAGPQAAERWADAAGHAGVAYGLTGLLASLPRNAARRQPYLPADMLDAEGVDRETIFAGKATPGLVAVLAALSATARRHLASAKEGVSDLASALRPVFLPLALVAPKLARLEKSANTPFALAGEAPPWQTQWRLWRASRQW